MAALRRWWSRKYNLPANHPLFLERSVQEHLLEVEENLLLTRDELEADLKRPGADRTELTKRLVEVRRALGDKNASTDPLIDKWERELANGQTPDLYEEG
jgi:hypothetical protein